MKRAAGILMHITSLPSKYGIGTLGKEAYEFADFLKDSGQSYWQVLPLTPTNYGDSPYSSSSVFAYNPYLIDFDKLNEEGLLEKEEYENVNFGMKEDDIDYAALFYWKPRVLKKTYKRKDKLEKEFEAFKKDNAFWLDGFSLYESIKEKMGFTAWYTWSDEYRMRDEKAIESYIKENEEDIDSRKFIQFLFYRQWVDLKKYVNSLGIEFIGDMPIYAAYDSADCWFYPERFYLDENLDPIKVAGCPPDQFSADGQLWGNPLYRWDKMKEEGYSWWISRIKKMMELVDVVRIDHFRGFAGYFTIPFGDKTARGGSWMKGPGYDLFKAINNSVPNAKIIAENLGFLDESVHNLLKDSGYPGMSVVQFDFGNGYDYHPLQDGIPQNNVIYTGTHDNQTIRSWYNDLNPHVKWCCNQFFGINGEWEASSKIIEGTLKTSVDTAIIPLQDYLGLYDYQGRMNTPSTLGINWRWRCFKGAFNKDLASYIKRITIESNR